MWGIVLCSCRIAFATMVHGKCLWLICRMSSVSSPALPANPKGEEVSKTFRTGSGVLNPSPKLGGTTQDSSRCLVTRYISSMQRSTYQTSTVHASQGNVCRQEADAGTRTLFVRSPVTVALTRRTLMSGTQKTKLAYLECIESSHVPDRLINHARRPLRACQLSSDALTLIA